MSDFIKVELSTDRKLKNLKPGNYVVKVRNINSYGVASPFTTQIVNLTVPPLGVVQDLTVTERIFPDNASIQLVVSFLPPNDSSTTYEVSYKIFGSSSFNEFITIQVPRESLNSTSRISYNINNVDSGKTVPGFIRPQETYAIVKVTPLSGAVRGVTSEVKHIIVGKDEKPNGLASFSVTQINEKALYFKYQVPLSAGSGLPLDLDLSHIEIRKIKGSCTAPTNSDFLSATPVTIAATPSSSIQVPSDTYGIFTFLAKTYDKAGNYSDFTSNVSLDILKLPGLYVSNGYSEDDPGGNNVITGITNFNYTEYNWPSFSNSTTGGLTTLSSGPVDNANGSSSGWSQGTDNNVRTLFGNATSMVYTTQIRSLSESVYTSVVADYVLNKTFNADTNSFKRIILENSTSPVGGSNANIFYFANISSYLNGATYNAELQTLTNAGSQGNTFAIWNTTNGPNSNSYALLAGVIDVNNVQLGATYYANGTATGSNVFANLTLHSGSFQLVDLYQYNDILSTTYEGSAGAVDGKLYIRYSNQNNVYDVTGNANNAAFTEYEPLDSQIRLFKHFQLKLTVDNLFPGLVDTKLEKLSYFTQSQLTETKLNVCMTENPKTVDLSSYKFSAPPVLRAIRANPSVNYTIIPTIFEFSRTTLVFSILKLSDASYPTDICVDLELEGS